MEHRVNQFDAIRATGVLALAGTKAWFDRPVESAAQFTQYMANLAATDLGAPDGDAILANEAIRHSLWCNSLLCGRWAMSGFPVVNLGHRTAAAFMATKIGAQDAVDYVRIPWPAFLIRLPVPLLTVEDDGQLRDANLLLVTCMDSDQVTGDVGKEGKHRWWYKLLADSAVKVPGTLSRTAAAFFGGISLWGFNVPTIHFAQAEMSEADGFTRWDTHNSVSSDFRSDQLARALIVAVCLYLSGDPRERAARESAGVTVTSRKSKVRPDDTLPPYTQYEIHSAIKINLHHTMRDYVRHGGGTPSVQTLVAGHWKRQAHGPGRVDRKLVHVQPYWRGDVDAPISTRMK